MFYSCTQMLSDLEWLLKSFAGFCCIQGYHGAIQIEEGRSKYPELCLPLVLVPATISNNVPGTDICIGCDTGLNAVCEVILIWEMVISICCLVKHTDKIIERLGFLQTRRLPKNFRRWRLEPVKSKFVAWESTSANFPELSTSSNIQISFLS